MKEFKVGDKVKSSSNGLEMVVIGIGSSDQTGLPVIRCRWYDDKQNKHVDTFPPETLTAITE
jgi:uncharacterized protein YodC (DUF2158 family)